MHSRSNGQFSVVSAGSIIANIFQLLNSSGDIVGELGQRTVNGVASPALIMNTGPGGPAAGYLGWRYAGLGTTYSVVLAGPGNGATLTLWSNGASSFANLTAQSVTINALGTINISGVTINLGDIYGARMGGYPLVGVHADISAARPGSGGGAPAPTDGGVYYETDTNELLQYYSSVGQWRRPWRMPWGTIGNAAVFANQFPIVALVDLAGLSVTWTPVANRLYRIMWQVESGSTVTGDLVICWLTTGANVNLNRAVLTTGALTFGFAYGQVNGSHVLGGLPGGVPFTVKLRLERNAGAGNAGLTASAVNPAILLVEDIGPNGAPA